MAKGFRAWRICSLRSRRVPKDGEKVDVRIWRKCDKRLAKTALVKLTSSDRMTRGGVDGKKLSTNSVGSRGAWQ